MLLTQVIIRSEHYTCILVKSSPEPYRWALLLSHPFYRWGSSERKWVLNVNREKWQGQDENADRVSSKGPALRSCTICLRCKMNEKSALGHSSKVSAVIPRLDFGISSSSNLSLPVSGTRSLALSCNLDSDQGCACLDKAAGTVTGLGGEAPGPGDGRMCGVAWGLWYDNGGCESA